MSEARERSPAPKALTAALEHASNELEVVNIAHHSFPISQGRSLQEETLSMSQDIVLERPQSPDPQPNQVPPEPTSRRFPIAPGYYLPRFIEYGDPMKDDEKWRCNITPPVVNRSYYLGRPLNPEAAPFITAHADQGGHRLTGEERVEDLAGVTPSNMKTSSDEDPPPVWTQQEHPYSWKARLASGNAVIYITQDAYSLLTALDPISYSLPYGSIIFGMKSANEANLRASMEHGTWCSTGMGNNSLQRAWNKLGSDGPKIILLFSVRGSNKYCGMAEMSGPVDSDARLGIWTNGSFRGAFPVRWIVCKDVTFVLFQDMMNPQNGDLPITILRDATALPEDLGRKVLRMYFEAPHIGNVLLGSTSESLLPGSLGPVNPFGPVGGLTAQPATSDGPDILTNVPLSPDALIRYGRQLPRRRLGYTPRVVGVMNVQNSQPIPAKSHELSRSPVRVPGAINDTTKGGSNVGATGSGDDVGSESGDDIFWQPSRNS